MTKIHLVESLTSLPKGRPPKNEKRQPDRLTITMDTYQRSVLEDLATSGNFSSRADAIRFSIQLAAEILTQVRNGHTEIRMRNPETKERLYLHSEVFQRP